MTKYNKTQLTPQKEFERHIYHRDQFAHYLRWTHVLKLAKRGMNILDFGCGSAELLEVLYRNRYKPEIYYGVDIRKKTIENLKEKWADLKFAYFNVMDLCKPIILEGGEQIWDIIASFEVIEHLGKENVKPYLENMENLANFDTIILLSTPCYDEKVGAAKNHIIDGEIGEFYFDELKKLLEFYFDIVEVYGTFASQKDYKPLLDGWKLEYFNAVKGYFDTNILSNLMAPLFPEHSRNCLWKLKKKEV